MWKTHNSSIFSPQKFSKTAFLKPMWPITGITGIEITNIPWVETVYVTPGPDLSEQMLFVG